MAEAKDKTRPDSGTSEGGASANGQQQVDMAEWEKRLIEGDLPEDFLEVTEPHPGGAAAKPNSNSEESKNHGNHGGAGATGLLVDIPTVTASNAIGGGAGNDETHQSPEKKMAAAAEDSSKDLVSKDNVGSPGKKPMSTEESDHALAIALQKQLDMESAAAHGGHGGGGLPGLHAHGGTVTVVPENVVGRLTVTVAEAKLARNYGMSRMDPYCRIRIGHSVYETPTCANGAREPKWNKTFNIFLLKGTKNVDVEIYDECTFTNDAMVAHATFSLPDDVFKFLVVDDWFPLSGQEGHEKEGVLHLIMSLQPLRPGSNMTLGPIEIRHPGGQGGKQQQQQQQEQPQQDQQQQEQQQRPVMPNEEQIDELCKMFPNLDKDVVMSVCVEKNGDQEATVNALLLMGQE